MDIKQNILNVSKQLTKEFLEFINKAVSPFHATQESRNILNKAGFQEISEQDNWKLNKGGKYFFTRNRSTIVAFNIGKNYDPNNTGFKIIGAHTDSPCLRLAPLSKLTSEGFVQTHVCTYGGGLWHTWFDRDITLAGRIIFKDENEKYQQTLFHHKDPLLKIPNLAIHLKTTEEREKFAPNTETHLRPIISCEVYNQLLGSQEQQQQQIQTPMQKQHYSGLLSLISESIKVKVENIVDLDLYFCDVQPSTFLGINQEFISSPRLDNLYSSFMSIKALTDPDSVFEESSYVDMVVLFDHEECGSQSFQGADGTIVKQTIERIYSILNTEYQFQHKADNLQKLFHNSFAISADMAHGVHPNYSDKHKSNHKVKINDGVVVKMNHNQRYATDAISSSLLKVIAQKSGTQIQDFIVKNDSPCGTTIGPMTAANTGIKTVDIGAPMLGMHSIRETGGVLDAFHYEKLFCGFFREYEKIKHDLFKD